MLAVRKRYTFTGSVQGVGFRWRARQAAALYDCTGWVRNEWDGSVTMEIQGREPDVDRVLSAIREGRFIRIEEIREEMIPEETGEYGFGAE
ncbi:acylphosphatase [Clostridiales bacterium]|nr:acylphosphatase [Clostridiales bacterium]